MIKSTGIVRKVDFLGRVVLPKELRRTLNINEGDGLEIYVDAEKIILKKYQPGCAGCGNQEGLRTIEGITLCNDCIQRFATAKREGKGE